MLSYCLGTVNDICWYFKPVFRYSTSHFSNTDVEHIASAKRFDMHFCLVCSFTKNLTQEKHISNKCH